MSRTPPTEISAAIPRILECWNGVMPANHVRRCNPYRYQLLTEALRLFTEGEITETIRWYAGLEWNQKRHAWQTFDTFLEVPSLTRKYESMMDDRDRDQARTARAQAELARLNEEQERARQTEDERAAVLTAFAALPADEQGRILQQAVEELRTLHKFMGGRLWPSLECWSVRMQAIVIMRRRGHVNGNTPTV